MNLKKRSPFLKNFIALFTGSAVAQLIPIALSPVLARIYSTDDFAVFGIFYSTLLMLSVIAAAKYEVAIVVPKSESESRKVAMVSAIASLFVFVLLAIVSMLFSDAFVDYVDNQKIRPWIPLILIGVLITGLYQSTSYWLIRRAKFKDLAINKVSQRVFEGASNLALGSAQTRIWINSLRHNRKIFHVNCERFSRLERIWLKLSRSLKEGFGRWQRDTDSIP